MATPLRKFQLVVSVEAEGYITVEAKNPGQARKIVSDCIAEIEFVSDDEIDVELFPEGGTIHIQSVKEVA